MSTDATGCMDPGLDPPWIHHGSRSFYMDPGVTNITNNGTFCMDPVRPLYPYIILRENIERDEGGGYVREDHAACGYFFF